MMSKATSSVIVLVKFCNEDDLLPAEEADAERLYRMSLTTATLLFVLYSVINGATLSVIFLAYTMESIASVFFITAGTFAVMAAIGSFTKTDLSSLGKILFMALIGLIIATLVNVFVNSSSLTMILSYVGVLLFVGLTAYDTQRIKKMLITADYIICVIVLFIDKGIRIKFDI